MLAALASPCRIKRKRHRWRRIASGRTVYGYVDGNPVSFTDRFGLAAEEIWFNGFDGQSADLYVSASRYHSPPGTFTLAAHGYVRDYGIRAIMGPHREPLSAKQVWNSIKDKYSKGKYKKIRVAACEAGKDDASGKSFADDLAAISGHPVEATPNLIGFPEDGRIFIGSPVDGDYHETKPIPGATWGQYP